MHLSRLTLNPRSKAARRDAANPYEMHRTLTRVTGGQACLWRLEDTMLLVQTTTHQDWGQLEPSYLARPSESKPLEMQAICHQTRSLRFRLQANPTVTKLGKRHGLRQPEEQYNWLMRQAERYGFTVLGAMVSQEERLQIRKPEQVNPIVLYSVLFDGHLKISNPEAFAVALTNGLGHSKALGLGLFSVG